MPVSIKRTSADSFAPPAFSGCARGCGSVPVAVDIDVTEEAGGDSSESGRKPPPFDLAGENAMLWLLLYVLWLLL